MECSLLYYKSVVVVSEYGLLFITSLEIIFNDLFNLIHCKNNTNKNVLIANYFCRFVVIISSFIWQVNILLACAGAVTFLHPLQLWIRSRGPRQYSSPVDNEIVVSPTDKAAEQIDGVDWSVRNYSQRWVVVPEVFKVSDVQ